MKKIDYTGLSVEIDGRRIYMVNQRGVFTRIDITPAFHFFKEFFTTEWKKRNRIEELERQDIGKTKPPRRLRGKKKRTLKRTLLAP